MPLSSSDLLDRVRSVPRLAFYYTGDHLDRSSDNGWWLADDLHTRSTRFPLEMSLRFVGEERIEYTFKLAMKKYVETIGFDTYEFGHWSLDVQSPFIRNAPAAAAAAVAAADQVGQRRGGGGGNYSRRN
jgi:hypothetical protein